MADIFMLGSTLETMDSLEELGFGEFSEPQAGYRPFSVIDRLGDGSFEGNGFPVVTWHWTGLEPGLADILHGFIGDSNISAYVYFRTRLNRLNISSTDSKWMTFGGWMKWTEGEEDIQALHAMDVTVEFTDLTPYPDYPYP